MSTFVGISVNFGDLNRAISSTFNGKSIMMSPALLAARSLRLCSATPYRPGILAGTSAGRKHAFLGGRDRLGVSGPTLGLKMWAPQIRMDGGSDFEPMNTNDFLVSGPGELIGGF